MCYYHLVHTIYLPKMVLAYLSNQYGDTCLYTIGIIYSTMFTDIDQTDLHRSEPSSRTELQDEHSYQ